MKTFRPIAALLPCLLAASSASAGVIEDIRQSYRAGDVAATYRLAGEHLGQFEGDPDFDYEFGVAAIDAGHVSQGVFALERVLLLRPKDHRARLELARGYYLLEQFDRARREFEAVLAVQPPASVTANIRRFLNLIRVKEGRYKSTASLTLDLDRGWDSNVNSAPFSPNFTSPLLGPGTLGNGSTQLGDAYTEVNVGANLTLPIAPGRYVGAALDVHHHANDRYGAFDTDAQTVTLSLTDNVDDLQTRFAFRAQNYELDHATYRTLSALSMDWRQTLSAQTQLTGFAGITTQHYPGADLRDADLFNAGVGVVHALALPGRPVMFLTVFLGEESPRENSVAASALAGRDIKGVAGGAQWTLGPRTSLTTTFTWQNSRYQAENILFLARREDDFGSLGVTLKHLLDDRWSLSATLNATTNDSNFPINRYDREVLAVNLRYEY